MKATVGPAKKKAVAGQKTARTQLAKKTKVTKGMPYALAKNRLAGLLDRAVSEGKPIFITRNNRDTVLLGADEYTALMETVHLISSPANARRLIKGLADYEAGKVIERELCD